MSDKKTFSHLAVLYELNGREFKRKLSLFPEELRYYVILANSIIGSENAKWVEETPREVVENSGEFVAKLLEMAPSAPDEAFRNILETCLVETLRDELRFNCPNCRDFNACLGIGDMRMGELFRRRVQGEETEELRKEIGREVDAALEKTPFVDTDEADLLCRDFVHHYSSASVGGVFGRYAGIAAALRESFGIDYARVQRRMIDLNMEFYEKSKRRTH